MSQARLEAAMRLSAAPAERRRRHTRGSTLIEFALCAFLLILVIFAGVELDRMAFVYVNLQDAAKAGIRYAIVHGNDRSSQVASASDYSVVSALVQDYLLGIDQSSVYVGCGSSSAKLRICMTYPNASGSVSGNSSGDPVTVRIQYAYDPWVLLPLNVTLSATSEGIIVF